MKNFKKSVLKNVLGSVLVIGAASSASSVIAAGDPFGSVAPITSMSKALAGKSLSFAAGTPTSVTIATGLINSNMPKGFFITVGSTNEGRMKRIGSSGTDIGSNVTYSGYELVAIAGGTLGDGATPFGKLPLVAAAKGSVTFRSGEVKSATVNKPYELKVEFTPSNDLLSGDYTDTITLGIVSLH